MKLDDEKSELEQYLRANRAAKFIDAVAHSASGSSDFVMTSVGAFAGEPDVLYAAVKYASLSGIELRLFPLRSSEAAA